MNAKQLTAAETIVMKCIWDADHEMSLAEIVKNANEGYGKEWKPQTVSTYLAKLCLKNYIQMKRAGRTITYEYSSRKRTTRVSRRGSCRILE